MNAAETAPTFLAAVESELTALLATDARPVHEPSVLRDAGRHLTFAGQAKRGRPLLTHFFGQAVGAPEDALVRIACAAELIHAASLLHDDVVDDGTTRRGLVTANVKWGNVAAVLSGDLVLSLGLSRLRGLPGALTADAIDLVLEMTRATMSEVQSRRRTDLTAATWRHIAEGKTGLLFAWCGQSAARVAGDDDAAERFARAARHFGVAFQMADDFQDLYTVAPGKDRFSDIKNGNPSSALIEACTRDAAVRDALATAWAAADTLDADTTARLGEMVIATGAAAHIRSAVDAEIAAGLDALGHYADKPGGMQVRAWAQKLAASVAGG